MTSQQITNPSMQRVNSGAVCPHCQSSQVFQRSKIENNTGKSTGYGCAAGFITFVVLLAYGVSLRVNDLSGYYYGTSWLYSPGSDMNLYIATLVVGFLAGVIHLLVSRKTVIYYECFNCKATW